MKKLLALLAVLLAGLAIALALLFYFHGQDHYDGRGYQARISDQLKPGSEIHFTLPDQFDRAHSIDEETRTLVMAFSRSAGRTVQEFLESQKKGFLDQRKALFVADITSIPTVLRNAIALPRLRKSEHSVLLIYEEEMAASFRGDRAGDEIAIVSLRENVVQAVRYASTKEELRAALE